MHQDLAFRKRFIGGTKIVNYPIMTHISAVTMWADDKRK
jgi:hypothetical protein